MNNKARIRPSALAVVGGGASGLAAAIEAARVFRQAGVPGTVTVLERLPRVGKKLLATGNGRCNLTNRFAAPPDYFEAADFTRPALERFPVEDTLDFFASAGLLCEEEEEGRIYPMSRQASGVLDALRLEAERLGVRFLCETQVHSLQRQTAAQDMPCFLLNESLPADAVILACGGQAAPQHGSDGSGYPLLRALRIPVTTVYPSLVPLTADPKRVKPLKGLRVHAAISLCAGGKRLAVQRGEIQFTDVGLSGIAAMQLSRLVSRERGLLEASLDLLPGLTRRQAEEYLCARIRQNPALAAEHLLTGILPKRVGQVLLKEGNIEPLTRPIGNLCGDEITSIADRLKDWRFAVTGTRGFSAAQVTLGGAQRAAFDPQTLEAHQVPGLFAAGEVLDVDAGCGGYNLQWAWSSGRLAGLSAAEKQLTDFRRQTAEQASPLPGKDKG